MTLTTPQVFSFKPFPSTEEYIFYFHVVSGNQVVKNQLQIQKTLDNTTVYNNTQETFQFSQTVAGSTLTNNTEYRYRFRTYDISNNVSQWSAWTVFLCLAKPIVTIDNIIDGKVNNQTFIFRGSYYQENGELLQSYRYYLYNEDGTPIAYSPEMFDGLLEYEFGGLQNNKIYNVELKVITVNQIEESSGLTQFTAEYIQPRLSTVVGLENLEDNAGISVNANIIQIIGKGENYSFIDNEKADVTNGRVWFDEGFSIERNFTLKIWLENIIKNKPFLKLYSNHGYIELSYYGERIHAFKYMYDGGLVSHFASNNEIGMVSSDKVYIFMQQINDLIELQFEVYRL